MSVAVRRRSRPSGPRAPSASVLVQPDRPPGLAVPTERGSRLSPFIRADVCLAHDMLSKRTKRRPEDFAFSDTGSGLCGEPLSIAISRRWAPSMQRMEVTDPPLASGERRRRPPTMVVCCKRRAAASHDGGRPARPGKRPRRTRGRA
jgi:hypothetical protein